MDRPLTAAAPDNPNPNATSTTITSASSSLRDKLATEQARSIRLSILTAAVADCPADTLGLAEDRVPALQQSVDQLLYAEFLPLPVRSTTKLGATGAGGGGGGSGSSAATGTATMLGVSDSQPLSAAAFSYTEKKAIRAATVEAAKRRHLQPVLALWRDRQRRAQQPGSGTAASTTSASASRFSPFQLAATRALAFRSAERRQQLQMDLLRAHERRCALLQRGAELCCSPAMADEMELRLRQLQLNGEKVGLLKAMVEREFVYRTEYSAKALRQAEGYLDEALRTYRK